MILSNTEMKELGSGITYNTHNTTSLIRTLKYVSDILQTEEAFTVKGYKHTHTHTQVVNGVNKKGGIILGWANRLDFAIFIIS